MKNSNGTKNTTSNTTNNGTKNGTKNTTSNTTIDDYIIRGELIALKDDPAYATKRHQVSAYISKIEIDKNL